jgi:ABC-type multidrug transport system fused ATPase/permease subunit
VDGSSIAENALIIILRSISWGLLALWFRIHYSIIWKLILSVSALVEINDLNFAYDKRPVLEGINMAFPKGKLIAIMGLSGCGKTTPSHWWRARADEAKALPQELQATHEK